MDDTELEELKDPRSWDLDGAQSAAPVTHPRAVVSVAFGRSDFELVTRSARMAGMKTSEFIREAALERAALPRDSIPMLVPAGSDIPSVLRRAIE